MPRSHPLRAARQVRPRRRWPPQRRRPAPAVLPPNSPITAPRSELAQPPPPRRHGWRMPAQHSIEIAAYVIDRLSNGPILECPGGCCCSRSYKLPDSLIDLCNCALHVAGKSGREPPRCWPCRPRRFRSDDDWLQFIKRRVVFHSRCVRATPEFLRVDDTGVEQLLELEHRPVVDPAAWSSMRTVSWLNCSSSASIPTLYFFCSLTM